MGSRKAPQKVIPMAAKQLTIELGDKGGKLTVRALIQTLEKALAALRDIDGDDSGQWEIVRVSMKSPLKMTVRSIMGNSGVPVKIRDLGRLEKIAKFPRNFGGSELAVAKELASIIPNEIAYLKLTYTGEKSAKLTNKFTENVETMSGQISRGHDETTTFEGRISQLDVPDGGKPDFRIMNRRTGKKIKCQFDPSMFTEVKNCIPGRVRVYGLAHYNAIGEPVSIEVFQFNRLRDRTELPQLEDLHNINITNGVDSANYVGRLRDGE